MTIICPHCKTECEGDADLVGTEVRCPACRNTFVVVAPKKKIDSSWWKMAVIAGCVGILLLVFAFIVLFDVHSNGEERKDVSTAVETEVESVSPFKKCVTIETVTGCGSGFFIKRNETLYVVTAQHIVDGEPFLKILDVDGTEHHAKIAYLCSDRDLALVKFDVETDSSFSSFQVCSDVGSLELEKPLLCLGDSEGKGVIVQSEGRLLGIGPKTIETDATIVPGNSGGPIVLKETGEVVGVATHLTNESDKWTKGTRFDNQIRRFGVRLDNVDGNNLFAKHVNFLSPTNYTDIVTFGKKSKNPVMMFACCVYAAEHGNAEGQTELAKVLLKSEQESDNGKALGLLIHAADQNYAEAAALLAVAYWEGSWVMRDYKKAFRYAENAAQKQHPMAMYVLGQLLLNGNGCIQDKQAGAKWIKEAAECGVPEAMMLLGGWFDSGELKTIPADYEKAIFWYEKAGEFYSDSLVKLGQLYSLGWIHHKSIPWDATEGMLKALACFEKADEKNLFLEESSKLECYSHIGNWYYKGLQAGNYGWDIDYNKAFRALRIAAQLGHPLSMYRLAECYRYGRGTAINMREAFEWNLKAAKAGDADAQEQAGLDYDFGEGVSINRAEAAFWYERAAKQGRSLAQYNLGIYYLKGEGVSENTTEAAKWFQKAADQKYPAAMRLLGKCYYFGWGVSKDMKKAADWIKQAIDAGDEQAQQFLRQYPSLKNY